MKNTEKEVIDGERYLYASFRLLLLNNYAQTLTDKEKVPVLMVPDVLRLSRL
ncbi:MAG: hypothetical protein WCV90_01890 [Candidatus Woesearchaeota archaeon]